MSKTFSSKSSLVSFNIAMRVTLSLKDQFTPNSLASFRQFHKVPYSTQPNTPATGEEPHPRVFSDADFPDGVSDDNLGGDFDDRGLNQTSE